MNSKILQVLAVIVEGLFSGKCDSCRDWKSCAERRERKNGSPGDDKSRQKNTLICPVFHWLDGIRSDEPEGPKTSEGDAFGDIVQTRPFHPNIPSR